MKHPLSLQNEDLDELLNLPLRLYVGDVNSEEVNETIEGRITKWYLAGNAPFLPAEFDFYTDTGLTRRINLFELKKYEIMN